MVLLKLNLFSTSINFFPIQEGSQYETRNSDKKILINGLGSRLTRCRDLNFHEEHKLSSKSNPRYGLNNKLQADQNLLCKYNQATSHHPLTGQVFITKCCETHCNNVGSLFH